MNIIKIQFDNPTLNLLYSLFSFYLSFCLYLPSLHSNPKKKKKNYFRLKRKIQRKCTCQRKKKRCYCFRPDRNENWLFSRYSTGWKCGLHADWTELTGCVDQELDKNEGETAKRRYFYITLLRSPIPRYLSEYRHVQRGATWKNARHFCLGRSATSEELPPCYTG
jgi:hypothetical protein